MGIDAKITQLEDLQSGVYCITNNVNNHLYIGSSKNIKRRWKWHRNSLKAGKHHSKYLQRAYDKYGEGAFSYSLLITCHPDLLLFYEQQFLDQLSPEYNCNPVAGSNALKRLSEETKLKLSAMRRGKAKTKEHAEKLAVALRKYNQENVIKIWKGLVSPEGIEYSNIVNLAKFCREHNLSKSHIHAVAIGKEKQYRGWRVL